MHVSRSLKLITLGMILPSLVIATFTTQGIPVVQAVAPQTCSALTLVSDTDTQTAGFTQVNPSSSPLMTSSYSGSMTDAVAAQTVIPPWIDPSTDAAYSGSGAIWISTGSTAPADASSTEGSAASDQWRLFRDMFSIPASATIGTSSVSFSADNAVAVYLNGTMIGSTNTSGDEVYASASSSVASNFSQVFTVPFTPTTGSNSLQFVLRNWGGDYTSNPTGLLYKATVNYCMPGNGDGGGGGGGNGSSTSTSTVKVIIHKFVDGVSATASSTSSDVFTMNAAWNATNTASGTGQFTLGPTGFNTTSSYTAVTSDMTTGASYSTNEVLNGTLVGTACSTSTASSTASTTPRYALLGYTVGDSLASAASGTVSSSSPSLTNITSDKHIIVWNDLCSNNATTTNNGTLQVTSVTAEKTSAVANGTYEDGWRYVFHVTVPTNEPNVAMRFTDWVGGTGSSTIPVTNNMRISSAQASSTGTVTITAPNVYTSPDLMITGDLDTNTAGRQIDILVEVKIPAGTTNGSYTTTYGVRSLP